MEMARYAQEFRGIETPIASALEDDDASFEEPHPAHIHEDQLAQKPGRPVTFGSIATVTVSGIDHDVVLSGDSMVVGRLSECDIHIQDANISRRHSAFEREGEGWAVQDLGSTNGTFINGERTQRSVLRNGDVVTVGVTELVFHEPRG